MAKRWYTHSAVYTIPKGAVYRIHIDGIYLNGDLFENNIPVVDCVAWLQIKPRNKHSVHHMVKVGFPTFDGTNVVRLGKNFHWLPNQDLSLAEKLFFNNKPYGMGLNTIAVQCYADFPITRDIVYDMSYIMEVDV